MNLAEDPYPDPEDFIPIPVSPIRPPDAAAISAVRISDTEDPLLQLTEEENEELRRKTAAASSALTLEMIGDIPFAAVRPPENILFVCKLNPVTQDEDLELIFSRFGKILSCEIVRDKKSGDSLQYAFIEFDEQDSAEQVSPFPPCLMLNPIVPTTLPYDTELTHPSTGILQDAKCPGG